MWRTIKLLVFLSVIATLGLIAYAYVGPIFFPDDFAPPTQQIIAPVTLEAT